MKPNQLTTLLGAGLLLWALLCSSPVSAQNAGVLSGTITDVSSAPVPGAKITIKDLAAGTSTNATTDSAGKYSVEGLASGEYELSVVAHGFAALTARVTLDAASPRTFDLSLAVQAGGEVPPELPNAPSSSKPAPSLEDLGFTPEQTAANAREQALLDKRTHMLKIHQRLGLITAAPLIASVATSINAGGKHTSNTDRNVHLVLGAVTGDLYFMTAYYAIRAPRIAGTETRGPIRFHRAMAWIHGPGMILTPILGAIAYSQKNNGEKVHGIAVAHGPVAIVTAGAFGAALLSVSMKF